MCPYPQPDLMTLLGQAERLDAADPLADLRERFDLPPGVVYLDGNSLGALPRGVVERLHRAVVEEWGQGLIRSWNDADWYPAPQRVAARIARLIGAQAHEVMACDSTTVNLFKLLAACAQAAPERGLLLCEVDNFPTDRYIAASVARLYGKRLVDVGHDTVEAAIAQAGEQLCALTLTQVHYKTGRLYDMARITGAVHKVGGRIIWDLAHSADVLPLELDACRVDYAVGCGYKYLNGGPGAPSFIFVREDRIASFAQPLVGWHGHAEPFAFSPDWQPHPGIERMLVGTAPQLSMLALEAALAAYDGVDLEQVRAKSLSLTELFIAGYDALLARHGLGLASPRAAAERGSQVSLTHPEGYAIMQALIARGVIGDFRAPDILRFGFAPLYVRHVDVVQALASLHEIMETGCWCRPEFQARKAVT